MPELMRRLACGALLCTVAATLVACGGGKGADQAASAAAAPLLLGASDVLTLQNGQLASGPVLSGSLQPQRKADLRAELSAVVLEVRRDNGDAVKAGDVLLRLDDSALRDSLLAAEAAVRAAEQAVEQADRLLARQKSLAGQGMVSQQAIDDATLRRASAVNDVASARALLAQARQQASRSVVRAPFAGVVAERQVSAGDTVSIGMALMSVVDPASLRFDALVAAEQAATLRVGQKVDFHVSGASGAAGTAGEGYRGTLQRIDPVANATTRQVAVSVTFDDAASAPRVAGLFAEGRVETSSTAAVLVPTSALVRAGDAAFVWRVNSGKLAKVPVVLGERDARSGDWVVKQGVAAGDRLLRHPGSTLADGQRVTLAAAVPAAASAASAATLAASR